MLLTVVLLLVPDVAAARSRPVQPGSLDLHTGARTVAPLLLSRDRVPLGHADLQQRAEGQHSPADGAHTQVLLLGR